MVRSLICFFIYLTIFEGNSKHYLIKTKKGKDNDREFGEDYGSRYGKGYDKKENSKEVATCKWDNWGEWSGSVTCGSGTKTRNRICSCSDGTNANADKCGGGFNSENIQYDKGPCYTCEMSDWSSYSEGSAPCGKSTSTRTRSCTCTDGVSRPGECGGGRIIETKTNDHGPCYSCTMSNWSTFTEGKATCGKSTSKRTRSCNCTDGVSRPDECGGGVTEETKENDHGPCTPAPYQPPAPQPYQANTPKPYRRRRNKRKRRHRM